MKEISYIVQCRRIRVEEWRSRGTRGQSTSKTMSIRMRESGSSDIIRDFGKRLREVINEGGEGRNTGRSQVSMTLRGEL